MILISREMLAHRVWAKTATPVEAAFLEHVSRETRPIPVSGSRSSYSRLALFAVLMRVSRPAPAVVEAFR